MNLVIQTLMGYISIDTVVENANLTVFIQIDVTGLDKCNFFKGGDTVTSVASNISLQDFWVRI